MRRTPSPAGKIQLGVTLYLRRQELLKLRQGKAGIVGHCRGEAVPHAIAGSRMSQGSRQQPLALAAASPALTR